MMTKHCPKCGEDKLVTEFHKSLSRHDSLASACKVCRNEWSAAYRAASPEKERANQATYYAANTEKIKAYQSAHYAANKEKIKAKHAAYYVVNQEKYKASQAEYYAANLEVWVIKNHTRRARKQQVGGKLSNGLKAELFESQGGLCACCGQPLGDKYHLDHIMPIKLGGPNTDENIQLLLLFAVNVMVG